MNPPRKIMGHGGTGKPTPPPTGGGISRKVTSQPRGATPAGYRAPYPQKPEPIQGKASKLAKSKEIASPVHIANAIEAAKRGISGLPASVLAIKGFSTPKIRQLIFNLLASEKPVNYLEVGAYIGGTACAAISQENVTAMIFEDGSQPFGAENVLGQLNANLISAKMGAHSGYTLVPDDFFQYESLRGNIDVFFYDGEHSMEKQQGALLGVVNHLADYSIFLVDDYDWPDVREGTERGLEQISEQFEVVGRWELSDKRPDGPNWHNGFAVFLLHRLP